MYVDVGCVLWTYVYVCMCVVSTLLLCCIVLCIVYCVFCCVVVVLFVCYVLYTHKLKQCGG